MEIDKINKITDELEDIKARYNYLNYLLNELRKDNIRFVYSHWIGNTNTPYWSSATNVIASPVFDNDGIHKRDDDDVIITNGDFSNWYGDFKDFFENVIVSEISELEKEANNRIKSLVK